MMKVKILRNYTGLSQAKFAGLFEIPLATYQDWEHERRTPPEYVVNMMQEILISRNLFNMEEYIKQCEFRKQGIKEVIALSKTATEGPKGLFLEDLERFVFGEITMEEIKDKINKLKY